MKGTNKSWRAQAGMRVQYASGRCSGTAIVVRVLAPARLGVDDGTGRYLVQDTVSGQRYEIPGAQMRPIT